VELKKIIKSIFLMNFILQNSKNGSTGLGMHIVHSIITKDLEGSIELDTTPGEGTSF
jgi:signal transduction histidine kinase